jgi:hypothetical protein
MHHALLSAVLSLSVLLSTFVAAQRETTHRHGIGDDHRWAWRFWGTGEQRGVYSH